MQASTNMRLDKTSKFRLQSAGVVRLRFIRLEISCQSLEVGYSYAESRLPIVVRIAGLG